MQLKMCVCAVAALLLTACGGGGGGTPPPSGQSPAQPVGIAVSIVSDDARVTWSANVDGLAASYRILRNGTQIGTSTSASFTDTRIVGGTTYSYAIVAVAAGGAVSAASAPASLTTPARYNLAAAGLLDGNSTSLEQGRSVVIGADGSFYIVGGTSAPDFPVTAGAYDTSYNVGGAELGSFGASDAFVAKLSPTGALMWATYLGGPNYDRAYSVALAPDGSVVVAGRAGRGFPTTAGTVQTAFSGDSTPSPVYGSQDGFVAKLSADGGSLLWATYFGGPGAGFIRDMDVAPNGDVLVAAAVNENLSLITGNAVQPTRRGVSEAVFARLNPTGSSVLYATYVGGTETGVTTAGGEPSVRAGPGGSVYFLTYDNSTNFLTTSGVVQPQRRGGSDFILVRFAAAGQVDFATYLGGGGDEACETHCLAVDGLGRAYVSGMTTSTDFPMAGGTGYQTSAGGGGSLDSVTAVVSADGRTLLGATYFGGNGMETTEGVSVKTDSSGAATSVFITGVASSASLVGTPDALQRNAQGSADGFLAEFSADLSHLRYMTFFGGNGSDTTRANAVAPNGTVAVVGETQSANSPSRNAFDTTLNGAAGATYGIFRRQ